MSQFITKNEELLLNDIDKIINFYINNNKIINNITISKKQKTMLDKLMKKAQNGPLYRSEEFGGGEVDINPEAYRGVKFSIITPKRNRYRKNSTMSIEI